MKYDYTGKTVFVGIDVHKKTYSLVCMSDGEVVKRWTTAAEPRALADQLKKYFTGATIKTCYEAGFAGFVLHRCLVLEGIDNIVVNPASIEVATRDKVKTDKRDALKMAQQLSAGRLRCIYIPSEEQERARLLNRTRTSLVKKRTSIGQQIKNRLYQFGYIPADSVRKMSQKWIGELLATDLGYEINISIKILGELWFELTKKINEMNKYLQEQAKMQGSMEMVYRSVPGIGPTSSRELANELGDMQHFSSERGLFSYTGLTPYEYSSGETKRLGHITRCGRGQLRRILIEVAWYAVRNDQGLATIYKRIALRAGTKRAIVAIARKLVGRIRACFKHGTLYEMGVM